MAPNDSTKDTISRAPMNQQGTKLKSVRQALTERRLDEAQRLSAALAIEHPASFQHHVAEALVAVRSAQWNEAAAAWRAARALREDSSEAAIGLATAQVELGELEQARASFEQIKARWPRLAKPDIALARMAVQNRDWTTALSFWDSAAEKGGNPTEVSYGRAVANLNAGHLDDAEKLFGHHRESWPNLEGGYAGEACVASARGDHRLALTRWRLVLERFPQHRDAWKRVGESLVDAGLRDEARQFVQEGLGNIEAGANRIGDASEILRRLDEPDIALEILECATADGRAPSRDLHLRRIDLLLALNRYGEARRLARGMQKQFGTSEDIAIRYAAALRDHRDMDRIVRVCDLLHRAYPGNLLLVLKLSEVLRVAGRLELSWNLVHNYLPSNRGALSDVPAGHCVSLCREAIDTAHYEEAARVLQWLLDSNQASELRLLVERQLAMIDRLTQPPTGRPEALSADRLREAGQVRTLVIAYVYYADLWPELEACIRVYPDASTDVVVIASEGIDLAELFHRIQLPEHQLTRVASVENRGLDAGPIWTALSTIDLTKYLAVTILHTKRSSHHAYGPLWWAQLLNPLGASREVATNNIYRFIEDPSLGVLGAQDWIVCTPCGTYPKLIECLKRFELEYSRSLDQHVSGTIFMIRASLLAEIYRRTRDLVFEDVTELGPLARKNHTYAHAIERLYGMVCLARGYRLQGVPQYDPTLMSISGEAAQPETDEAYPGTPKVKADADILWGIDSSWSDDTGVGLQGWIFHRAGTLPGDVQLAIGEVSTTVTSWLPRPDVAARFPDLPVPERCGFVTHIPRMADHLVELKVSDNTDRYQSSCRVAGRPAHFPEYAHRTDPLYAQFIEAANQENKDVLELGSRLVSPLAKSNRGLFPRARNFIGFDYHADDNTDISGDAHKLSLHVGENSVDALFSNAVFEHLAMPWVVAAEIARCLRVGGITFHLSTFAWPNHDRPCDYWRFSDDAYRVLFCPALGFEIIDACVSEPVRIHFDSVPEGQAGFSFHPSFATSTVLARKVRDVDLSKFSWPTTIEEMLGEDASYPLHQR